MLRAVRFYLKHILVLLLVAFFGYWVWLDRVVIDRFQDQQWHIPARVYAAPLELFVGATLSIEQFVANLELLGYRRDGNGDNAGQFAVDNNSVRLTTRGFQFPDSTEAAGTFRVDFDRQTIKQLAMPPQSRAKSIVRLEPLQIGVIHPGVFEDRILVTLSQVRPIFRERLVAVEDKRFFEHPGIDIRGILRALVANALAGRMQQGGSTITQQLIKNLYLSRERSLQRKFREALMAFSVERKFSKEEILQAYLNEIYLGQDGNRAIHGFGLAAEFYFAKPLRELGLAEQALLIGLAKGPSAYDPRRRPERALKRRNTVLAVLLEAELVSPAEYGRAVESPLGVIGPGKSRAGAFSGFNELVHHRLLKNYARDDLQTKGLRIFTAMDPLLQTKINKAGNNFLEKLTASDDARVRALQIGSVWADPLTAEVKGLLGGRGRSANYNRALYAKRQIGSLVKPVILAEALSRPEVFQLGTLVNDDTISLTDERGETWEPRNYDRNKHGPVTLIDALVNSYNLAMIDLGLKLGIESIVQRMRLMGLERDKISPYPSILLGAIEMTPFEVAQLYHTIANQGFYAPLRAIRSVVDSQGKSLRETKTTVSQAMSPEAAYLTSFAMQSVVADGTARRLNDLLPESLPLAGKTGTTDDTRDSWFAAFGDNLLGVVWLGNDDAASTGLTGSSGALRAWGEMAKAVGVKALTPRKPATIEDLWFDPQNGLTYAESCNDSLRRLPAALSPTVEPAACNDHAGQASESRKSFWDGLRNLFDSDPQ